MTERIRPGDVLADRYLLVDLLSESAGGRFFRAHDRVLDRHVALHIIADDDPRADALTEAARVSATVLDPHLLRVLDMERSDGRCFVVNEWGNGTSLDILVTNEGPVRPRRAAWIVSEVAACLAVAHEQRVAHGRLVPEHVLLDTTGAVRLIGFCVDAALTGTPPGQISEDVVDLGGLLYYLLTGKWGGGSTSICPVAPRSHGRVLRPRQVRAGVPRDLDRICDQVLNPFSSAPGDNQHNLHTAAGIAEVLREYVGDPAGLAEAEPLGGIRGAGALAVPHPPRPTTHPSPVPTPHLEPGPDPDPDPDPEPTQVAEAVDEPGEAPADTPVEAAGESRVVPAVEPPIGQPEDSPTQAGVPVFGEDEDVSWLERRSDKPPPPPAFEDPPARPLFAPEPASGEPARRSRPGSGDAGREYWPWENAGGLSSSTSGVIPVYDESEESGRTGRPWLRIAGLLAAGLLLLVAMVIAYNLGRGKTLLGSDPSPSPTQSSATQSTPPTPIKGVTATDLDPQGDPPEENPELSPLAVDGDPSTDWHTNTYTDQLGPTGLKTGVGLVLDTGSDHQLRGVRLTLLGRPSGVQIYASKTEPTSVEGLTPVASFTARSEKVNRTFESPVDARYVVVWFTELPPVDGGFQGGVADAEITQ